MIRKSPVLLLALCFAACSNQNDAIADACMVAIIEKGNQQLKVDQAEIRSGVSKADDGTFDVRGKAVYAEGTDAQRTLPYYCSMKVDNGQPSVVRVEFDYDTRPQN